MAKSSKEWQNKFAQEEVVLKPWQKFLIIAVISFVPFFVFVILPLLVRNHIVQSLKLPEEILLQVPQFIDLRPSDELPRKLMKITVNKTSFQIPHDFTPVRIENDFITFRKDFRTISRQIFVAVSSDTPELNYDNSLLLKIFMSRNMLKFFESSLRATWHPVKLSCKAHLLLSQGVLGRIFESRWDVHHRGFIFPTSGSKGYISRVFRTNGKGYFEFAMDDQVNPVTIEDWMDLAVRIKPPADQARDVKQGSGSVSLASLITKLAQGEGFHPVVLESALNEFFRTGDYSWIVPVAQVMAERGFYKETVAVYRKCMQELKFHNQEKALLREIFKKALQKTIELEIDPTLDRGRFSVFCKNLIDLPIRNIRVKIKLNDGKWQKEFEAMLFASAPIHGGMEKLIDIIPPTGVSEMKAGAVSWEIDDLEIMN